MPATLLFKVAEHLCGIAAADVQEIVFLPALTRLPGQPAVIEGFMNLRGSVVPVIKLDRLFDLGPRPAALHTTLIVVGRGERVMALAVDRVEELASIAGPELRLVGKDHSFNDSAIAEFELAGRGATLLASDRILLEKERQCVAELRARAQAQLDTLGTPAR